MLRNVDTVKDVYNCTIFRHCRCIDGNIMCHHNQHLNMTTYYYPSSAPIISLDAVQKGRTIHEDIAQNLLKRGLIEGEAPHYSISLSIAKNTHQLPSYTKTKGLDKERLRQMVLQYLSNAGEEGAKRDSIYEYIKDVLPINKTEEQKLRMLGDLLKNMSKECLIKAEGRTWYTIPQS